jgi:CubicO group peptidase (beta-lactamase class C family)
MPESRRSLLRLAGGAFAARALAAADDAPSLQELAAMEGVASAFMSAHSVPGLSVAVARDGDLLYQRGFGFADREKNERVTPAHLFRIASISKPITSVTLFCLMEDKHLTLEDKRLTLEDTVFGPRGILGDAFGKAPYKPWVEEIRI